MGRLGYLCSPLDERDLTVAMSDHISLFTNQIKYYNIAVLVIRLFISMLFAVQSTSCGFGDVSV